MVLVGFNPMIGTSGVAKAEVVSDSAASAGREQWLKGNITYTNGGVTVQVITLTYTNTRTAESVVGESTNNGTCYEFVLSSFAQGYEVGDEIFIEGYGENLYGKAWSGNTPVTITADNIIWADILLIDPPPFELVPPEPLEVPEIIPYPGEENPGDEGGEESPAPVEETPWIELVELRIPPGFRYALVDEKAKVEVTLRNLGPDAIVRATLTCIKPDGSEETIGEIHYGKLKTSEERSKHINWWPDQTGRNWIRVEIGVKEHGHEYTIVGTSMESVSVVPSENVIWWENMVITEPSVYKDATIIAMGGLTIEAETIFGNVTLVIDEIEHYVIYNITAPVTKYGVEVIMDTGPNVTSYIKIFAPNGKLTLREDTSTGLRTEIHAGNTNVGYDFFVENVLEAYDWSTIKEHGLYYSGIQLTSTTQQSTFDKAYVEGGFGHGIYAVGYPPYIKDTRVRDNNGDGIHIVGNSPQIVGTLGYVRGKPGSGHGIYVEGGSPTISGVQSISGNGGDGIYIVGGSPTISGVQSISGNGGDGIHIEGGSTTISGPGVEKIVGNNGYGIYVDGGISIPPPPPGPGPTSSSIPTAIIRDIDFIGSYVEGGNTLGGIRVVNGASATIQGNVVSYNSGDGISVYQASATIENNLIHDHANGIGVRAQGSSSVIIQTNPAYSSTKQQIYANKWAGIQMIDSGGIISGNMIYPVDSTANIRGIFLEGSSPTITENDIRNFYEPSVGGYENAGIIVYGCSPTIEQNYLENNWRGVLIRGAASPSIVTNTFQRNVVGIAAFDLSTPVPISIRGNTINTGIDYIGIATYGYNSVAGNPSIENNILTGLAGYSSTTRLGIYNVESSPDISGNTITNYYYGIYNTDASPFIRDNTIEGDLLQTSTGIYFEGTSSSTVYHNTIQDNRAYGIYSDGASLCIDDNTITNNGYGIYMANAPTPAAPVDLTEVTTFSDGAATKTVTFDAGGTPDVTPVVTLPKDPRIVSATMDLTGQLGPDFLATFDSSAEGFSVENDQPYSDVHWDSANGRVYFKSNRLDPGDEMFTRPLTALIDENVGDWELTARTSLSQDGNWVMAYPLFICDPTRTSVNGPNSIFFYWVDDDIVDDGTLIGNSLGGRYIDESGVIRINFEQEQLPINTEYHLKVTYSTQTLTLCIMDQNDVTIVSGSYTIGTNPSDGFTLGKVGISSCGTGQFEEAPVVGWTDDIQLQTSLYPTNPRIDVGDDGTSEWAYSGTLTTTVTVSNSNTKPPFTQALQAYLDDPANVPDAQGNLEVPLALYASSAGKIDLSNLRIIYGSKGGAAILRNDISQSTYTGIYLTQSDYVDIYENTVTSSGTHGIYLYSSDNCLIGSNTANSNYNIGIYLEYSSYNDIANNVASYNAQGAIWDAGIALVHSDYNTITGNTAEHNQIAYGTYGIRLWWSDYNTLMDNICEANGYSGIHLHGSCWNAVNHNTLTNNIEGAGLSLWDNCNYNTLGENTASGNWYGGVMISYGQQNEVSENIVLGHTGFGIQIWNSVDTIISGNVIEGNGYGIKSYGSDCDIEWNSITLSASHGIFMLGSSAYIFENDIDGNGGDGIWCEDQGTAIPPTTVIGNRIWSNQWGVHFRYRAPANAATINTDNDFSVNNALGRMIQEWWLQISVYDRFSSPLADATVLVYDVNDPLIGRGITDTNGMIPRIDAIEYHIDNSGITIPHTPHTILAETTAWDEIYVPPKQVPVTMDMNRGVQIWLTYQEVRVQFSLLWDESNYLSFPLCDVWGTLGPVEYASDLAAEINAQGGSCSRVRMFNSATQTTLTYNPSDPTSDFLLLEDYGYWVTVTVDSTLTLNGYLPGNREIQLYNLVNIIGWTSYNAKIWASDIQDMLGANFIQIGHYEEGVGWIFYPSAPDFQLEPKKAYRLDVNAPCILSYSEPYLTDTDSDGIVDGTEIEMRTNPFKPDTDADGVTDLDEDVTFGSDPTAPNEVFVRSTDWIIDTQKEYDGIKIEVNGDLIVTPPGSLTLTGTTMTIAKGYGGITVESGAELYVSGSTITSDPTHYSIEVSGKLMMIDSLVEYADVVLYSSDVTIEKSIIFGGANGVECYGATITIKESTLENEIRDLTVAQGSHVGLLNTKFNTSKVVIQDTSDIMVRCYLQSRVLDEDNNPIPNAQVSVRRSDGLEVFNGVTDDAGYIPVLTLDINSQSATAVVDHTPYAIRAWDSLTWYELNSARSFERDEPPMYLYPLMTSESDVVEVGVTRPEISSFNMWLASDTDNDGLNDGEEKNLWGTNHLAFDTDGDGLSDGIELGLTTPHGGLTDLNIFVADDDTLSFTNAKDFDTDGDWLPDGWIDGNGNGVPDLGEYEDRNLNGKVEDGIWNNGTGNGETDPTMSDSDNDSMPDGWEELYWFDPLSYSDSILNPDSDYLINVDEYKRGTDPYVYDAQEDVLSPGEGGGTGWRDVVHESITVYACDNMGWSSISTPIYSTTLAYTYSHWHPCWSWSWTHSHTYLKVNIKVGPGYAEKWDESGTFWTGHENGKIIIIEGPNNALTLLKHSSKVPDRIDHIGILGTLYHMKRHFCTPSGGWEGDDLCKSLTNEAITQLKSGITGRVLGFYYLGRATHYMEDAGCPPHTVDSGTLILFPTLVGCN
ncbi:MAG: right-handed parallel beta-helix repeat-containing protein [Candidatus Thermoplasmatota archaeon]